MDRRHFIRSCAAVSSLAFLGGWPQASHAAGHEQAVQAPKRPFSELGVQLYTIRFLLAKDYKEPLKRIAAIGYKDLEFFGGGLFQHNPADVKAFMDDLGLVSRSTHVGIEDLRNRFDTVLESAAFFGQKDLILPYLVEKERDTIDKYKSHAELLNRRGEQAKASGFQIAYHNHDFEFAPLDGAIPYDLLLQETDADLVKMQLDFYWVVKAGLDILALFDKSPGRFISCHLKDHAQDGSMAAVGAGTIDFDAIFRHADKAGLERYYVEHDNTETPLESIEQSYAYLMGNATR